MPLNLRGRQKKQNDANGSGLQEGTATAEVDENSPFDAQQQAELVRRAENREYEALQLLLNSADGLKDTYLGSYEVVGLVAALIMGFAYDGLGDPPVALQDLSPGKSNIWRSDSDTAVNVYLTFLGAAFSVSFGTLIAAVGGYAVMAQTPNNAFHQFVKHFRVPRLESIHGLQSLSIILYGVAGLLRVSLVSEPWTFYVVISTLGVFGLVGHYFFSTFLKSRRFSMNKTYHMRKAQASADQASDGLVMESAFDGSED